MKKTRKAIALALVFALALTLVPVTPGALAAVQSGKCGKNLTWKLDTETGALNITGTGDMYNWNGDDYSPWSPWGPLGYSFQIKTVRIAQGVTSIGTYAFYGCDELTRAVIPGSVREIGASAFEECYSLAELRIGSGVKTIGESAFCTCQKLTSVAIPKSVTKIGLEAFGYDFDDDAPVPDPSFLIYGNKDSAAHKYAKKYKFAFCAKDNAKLEAPQTTVKKGKKLTLTVAQVAGGGKIQSVNWSVPKAQEKYASLKPKNRKCTLKGLKKGKAVTVTAKVTFTNGKTKTLRQKIQIT